MRLHCKSFDFKKWLLFIISKSPINHLKLLKILSLSVCLCSLCCHPLSVSWSVFLTLSSHSTVPDSVTCLCSFYHSLRGRGMAAAFPEARHKGLRMDGWMARGTKPTTKLLSDTSHRFETYTHTETHTETHSQGKRVDALEQLAP